MAESLYRCQELRGIRRERRVGCARLSGHRDRVVRRAGAVQHRSTARRALSPADVFQSDGPGESAVQCQPSIGGQEHFRGYRYDAMRPGAHRHGPAAASVRIPRVHIRARHHHVRVHPQLPSIPGVRFPERCVVVVVVQ